MTDFKIGDIVRLKTDTDKMLTLVIRGIGSEAARSVDADALCISQCGMRFLWASFEELELVSCPDPQADIKQAIRKVLLSDEFMKAFAAAWMRTPLPIGEYAEPGEPTNANSSGLCCGGPEADADNFGECVHCGNMLCGKLQKTADSKSCLQANARVIPGTPVGWELVGFKQIQDDLKVFDKGGDYWTFSGTNDAGDLTSALMPIFEKIEATNDPT